MGAPPSSSLSSSPSLSRLERQLMDLIEEHGSSAVQETLNIMLQPKPQHQQQQQPPTPQQQPTLQQQQQQEAGSSTSAVSALLLTAGIMETSFDCILVTNEDGQLQLINGVARKLFGLSKKTLNSITLSLLLVERTKDNNNRMQDQEHQQQQHQQPSEKEWLQSLVEQSKGSNSSPSCRCGSHVVMQGRRYNDGQTISCLHVRVSFIPEKSCFVIVCHDQTPYLKVMLRLSHKRYLLAQERHWNQVLIGSDGNIGHDQELQHQQQQKAMLLLQYPQGIIQRVNPKCLQIFQYTNPQEVLAKHASILFPPSDDSNSNDDTEQQHCIMTTMMMMMEPGLSSHQRIIQARRSDGTQFACQISIHRAPAPKSSREWIIVVLDEAHDTINDNDKDNNDQQAMVPIVLPSTTLSRDFCQMYLMQDPSHTAEWYPDATILFAGVAGFTKMSQSLTPIQAVDFLSSVFCRFDDLLSSMSMTTKVHKVKTVGDCYMVAALEPNTCAHMCHLALCMIQAFSETLLDLRIGIHTGPVMAGVVKSSSSNSSSNATNPQQQQEWTYDMWGEAVNLASHLESYGVPGRVQVTRAVVDHLTTTNTTLMSVNYSTEECFVVEKRRGMIDIKGDGLYETYFVMERVVRPPTFAPVALSNSNQYTNDDEMHNSMMNHVLWGDDTSSHYYPHDDFSSISFSSVSFFTVGDTSASRSITPPF